MKYCWSTQEKLNNPTAGMTGILIALCVVDISQNMWNYSNPLKYLVTMVLLVSPMLWHTITISILTLRKYRIDSDGLTLQYPFGILKHYKWEDFSEIAVCKVHFASKVVKYNLAIRCVVGEEKRGPKRAIIANERWTRVEYEAWHFGKIITIFHTDERYEEFAAAYPYEIKDYQHLDGFYTLSREDFL